MQAVPSPDLLFFFFGLHPLTLIALLFSIG